MCGIAGYVGSGGPKVLGSAVKAMVKTLARRGPDSEHIHSWTGACLGHRRLAILDLSEAGRQPLLSDDLETGVVFNGCIYNFLELRSELEKQGHRFRSNCDTEVLVRGYEEWGIDELTRRLHGMFAFGLWDNKRKSLFLVRDRLGVKPLVYATRGRQIAFASTLTALNAAGMASDVNPEAILEFLEFGWISDGLAVYEGAQKLPAASILEFHDGISRQRSYWRPTREPDSDYSFDKALEKTESLFLDAVRMRLISDVPIGSLLSGGIDSALICWALKKLNANVKAFTISTPGDPVDESLDATETARVLDIPHEVIALPADEEPALADLINAYSEPFACASALGMLRVCKAVKPQATVLLTGDGGDDVFLGYQHHRTFMFAQHLAARTPDSAAWLWRRIRPSKLTGGHLRRAANLLDYVTGGLGAVTRVHDGLPYFERSGMLGERLTDLRLSNRQIEPSINSARSLLTEYLEYERNTRFVAEYMTKVDGGAMHHAIEARSPFLDQAIWEFASRLPYEVRLRNGELKAVLRAIARRRIGAAVAGRQKRGFSIPIGRWLATKWKAKLNILASDSLLEREGWIRKDSLSAAANIAISSGEAPSQLWYLVVLESWMRQHCENNLAQSANPRTGTV